VDLTQLDQVTQVVASQLVQLIIGVPVTQNLLKTFKEQGQLQADDFLVWASHRPHTHYIDIQHTTTANHVNGKSCVQAHLAPEVLGHVSKAEINVCVAALVPYSVWMVVVCLSARCKYFHIALDEFFLR